MGGEQSAAESSRPLTIAPPGATVSGLFARHYLELVRLAMHLVDDQETAEDVVQDVFLGVASERMTDFASPERYLRAAVVNRCRSALRRRRVTRLFVSQRRTWRADVHVDSADARLLSTERRQRVLAAVRDLPARQREVVVLRYYLDLDLAAIAGLLSITPSAASSSLGRALSTLTTKLGDRDA